MLFKKEVQGHVVAKTRPLLTKLSDGYVRPGPGKEWFATTTTVWRVDELIRRQVRDWRRLTDETGHSGERTAAMRADHDSVYTGTHSVFPAPLMEWILLRYGGLPTASNGKPKVLDAFAGGPPRGVVSSVMGYSYHGVEIRQEQIDENVAVVNSLGLSNVHYHLGDARLLSEIPESGFDCAVTCPPYYDLEVYSNHPADISTFRSYDEFNAAMALTAYGHFDKMKPGAFVCIVVGPFRNKKSGELIDFPAHTVQNFREAGFVFWQQIVLGKNFASAAKRSTNAWRGLKLVPAHEFLQVFRTPGW